MNIGRKIATATKTIIIFVTIGGKLPADAKISV